jgi:hypothetical protein
MKMSKEWCLKQCLFYRGEAECPAILKAQKDEVWSSSWFMEKLWADGGGEVPIEYSDQYFRAGLSDFNSDDGVHLTLKEFLYGYGQHRAEGMMTTEEFKNWYDFKYKPFGDYYKSGDLKG